MVIHATLLFAATALSRAPPLIERMIVIRQTIRAAPLHKQFGGLDAPEKRADSGCSRDLCQRQIGGGSSVVSVFSFRVRVSEDSDFRVDLGMCKDREIREGREVRVENTEERK